MSQLKLQLSSFGQLNSDCHLDLLKESDASKLAAYYSRNRAYLKQWEPRRTENYFTVNGWQEMVKGYLTLIKQQQLLSFVIHDQDQIIGVINYSQLKKFPSYSCFVGYSLDQKKQGLGLMTRSLIRLNHLVFQQHIHRINACVMPKNERSLILLKKVGFHIEGLAKQYLLIDGCWEDHYLVALINDQSFN